ncbi:TPA: 3-phosphoglycerate dehydrogenase [Candidatus Avacholeplasma faecigallinarum]|nr:3-phosphoglycerate dehydrogenase [Candidatus Avacholeplasma faecigallinarum]
MKAYCLNKISEVALKTLNENDKVVDDVTKADCILVRSYNMHEFKLDKNILAVARAGAGVNNIPLNDYANEGVVVFNTPGANANAVKELVLCAMLLASRDILGGINYVKENKDDKDIAKNVEKAKSKYAGHELKGKKVAVIGLGVIGVLVANSLIDLGMNVIGYDPFLSIGNAMKLHKEVKYVEALEDCVKDCDYVTIHVPLNPNTKHMLNKKIFEAFKDNTILINFSRDTLVCDDDLQWALNNSKVSKYVTDFANEQVVKLDNVICLPHLGASTAEAEDNCALMAINQLRDYLENGNILNSVNYPDLNASIKQGQIRVCINHKNVVGMIAKFSSIISDNGGNILTLTNKSRNDFAYTVIDVDKNINIESIEKLEGVLRVRVI